jgi:hypothetical protein
LIAAADPLAEHDPADRIYPAFQGQIGPDIAFFGFAVAPAEAQEQWVAIEEPDRGYRFWETKGDDPLFAEAMAEVATGASGAEVAARTFANPIRVMIRGDEIIPRGPDPS